MSDETKEVADGGTSQDHAQPLPPVSPAPKSRPDSEIDAELERKWRTENIDLPAPTSPPEYAGRAPVAKATLPPGRMRPVALVNVERVECEHCKGVGYLPGVNDLLLESAGLLGGDGDEVIRLFYTQLFAEHPQMRALFPGDPTKGDFGSDDRGATQRDRLLGAIGSLAELYDPAVPAKMDRLDTALKSFGRHHAAFARPDGTVSAATLEEYAWVKAALFSTLIRVTADKWKPEYSEAWSRAYDYAAGVMMAEQHRSGFTAPRYARGGVVR
jgi:hemoglobin-like flavoprotein